jgi:hypothetical protein
MLAAEGVDGPLGVVEEPRGLLRHLSFAARPAMLGELGRVWLTDTLAFKPFPGCAYLQAAVEAILRSGVAARDVSAVTVEAGYLTVAMERLGEDGGLSPVGVNFSAARSVAVALVAGRLTHEELSPGWLAEHAAEVRELTARVSVEHDWSLSLASARGVVEAGASIRDVPARAWPRVLRRVRELGMEEAVIPPRELAGLVRSRELRGELRALLSSGGGDGLAGLDTGRLRMTFPCRLRVRLHSGRVVELEGEEPGASARPVEEQRGVVEARCRAAGLRPAAASR